MNKIRSKTGMIPGVNISRKSSTQRISGAGWVWGGGGGALSPSVGGSKEHREWLKIDLNVAKIITV